MQNIVLPENVNKTSELEAKAEVEYQNGTHPNFHLVEILLKQSEVILSP